jgi:hypothetical protein
MRVEEIQGKQGKIYSGKTGAENDDIMHSTHSYD